MASLEGGRTSKAATADYWWPHGLREEHHLSHATAFAARTRAERDRCLSRHVNLHAWRVKLLAPLLLVFLVASLLLTAVPGDPSSYLFLVVRPGAPSGVVAPSSDALCS